MYSKQPYSKHLNNLKLGVNHDIFFSGIAMLILNIGTKYITLDLSDKQDEFLKNIYFRRFVIFIIFWIGTKDVKYSLGLTLLYIISIVNLLNENSKYYLFKSRSPE